MLSNLLSISNHGTRHIMQSSLIAKMNFLLKLSDTKRRKKNIILILFEILSQLKENQNILHHINHIKQELPVKIKYENGETYEIQRTFVISIMPFYKYYNLQKFSCL